MLTKEEMTIAVQAITAHGGSAVQGAYIFGSHVTDFAMMGSDVDFAILCGVPLTADIVFALKTELSYRLKRDIDVVDLRRADTVTRAQVVSSGEVILVSDQKSLDYFETDCLSAYALLNEERVGIIQDIASRGSVYG